MKFLNASASLLGVTIAAGSLVACVYASSAPKPGGDDPTASSTDGTDPTGDVDGSTSTGGDSGGDEHKGQKDAGASGEDAGDQDSGGQQSTDAGSTDAGSTDAGSTDAGDHDAGSTDAGKDAGPTAPTWTTIYTDYFGAGSLGHCGDSGCHLASKSGFKCGSDKTTCYNGLVKSGFVDGTSSTLSTSSSPLTWFGSGNMPPSGGSSAAAKADITAWVKAGALDN